MPRQDLSCHAYADTEEHSEARMITALVVTVFLIAGLIHLLTGHSVLFWVAKGCIVIDAAFICAGRELKKAAIAWWQELPTVIAEVRAEVVR